MKPHGQFFQQQMSILQVNIDQSKKWLKHVEICVETDVTLCTAMKQMLVTNNKCKKIFKQD
eukprot:12103333-Ditylum_brightwellii.AAC.1